MNSKKLTVSALAALVIIAFVVGMNAYKRQTASSQAQKLSQENTRLVRPHSPVFGPMDAPVTIVEFFDPACESCRAFYPHVKALLNRYPKEVRLVLRYAPLHEGSDKVVRLLESAKRQDKYLVVLEKILADQPRWADHRAPQVELVYDSAASVGLDVVKAKQDAAAPDVEAALRQDIEDLRALEVTKTPTFIVNGRGLTTFGPDALAELVAEEVSETRR